MTATPVHAYEVTIKGHEEGANIVNAASAGKAKYSQYLDWLDPLPDLKFTDLRVRKIGNPHTSDRFKNCAEYRRLPNMRCGQRIRLRKEGSTGTVVGHNSSANFNVLFDETSTVYHGLTLSVHPTEMELIP